MKIINLISIALLVLILFFSGCIENKPTSKTEINTPAPTPLPKQYIDMDFKQFVETMESDKVTILQKQNLYDSSIGKYVRWRGEVEEVTQNSIYLKYIDKFFYGGDVLLFVTGDKITELASLNKGDKITFEGMITKESIPHGVEYYRGYAYNFQLFNGKIISKG